MNEQKLLCLVLLGSAALTILGCEADINTSLVVREIDGFIDDFTTPVNPLVGTWMYTEPPVVLMFVFREDGTFTETIVSADAADDAVALTLDGIYSTEGDIVILEYFDLEWESLQGIWEIAGDSLIITPIEEGVQLEDETLVFTRLD